MKGLLKSLGMILILAGAIALIACAFTGNVNNNAVLGGCMTTIIAGLIAHIVINKRITD